MSDSDENISFSDDDIDANLTEDDMNHLLDGTYLERHMTRIHIQMLQESNGEADELLTKITGTWREVRHLRESAIDLLSDEGKKEQFRKAVKNFKKIYKEVFDEYLKIQAECRERVERVDQLFTRVIEQQSK